MPAVRQQVPSEQRFHAVGRKPGVILRFLVDECTGPAVALWLREERGYEVFSVYHEARGASDEYVIAKAFDEGWILITNDKDFGEKVFRERHPHRGVIFLRVDDERPANQIEVLRQLLNNYGDRLADNFVVVTEKQIRFSRAPSSYPQ